MDSETYRHAIGALVGSHERIPRTVTVLLDRDGGSSAEHGRVASNISRELLIRESHARIPGCLWLKRDQLWLRRCNWSNRSVQSTDVPAYCVWYLGTWVPTPDQLSPLVFIDYLIKHPVSLPSRIPFISHPIHCQLSSQNTRWVVFYLQHPLFSTPYL